MGKFADDIRLAIYRYKQEGYTIRPLTPEEIAQQVASIPAQKTKKQLQLPFKERVKQVHRVNELVAKLGITKLDACGRVGIGYGNYKELTRKNPDVFKKASRSKYKPHVGAKERRKSQNTEHRQTN